MAEVALIFAAMTAAGLFVLWSIHGIQSMQGWICKPPLTHLVRWVCRLPWRRPGSYYGAPRVRDGFRAILPDECYVANVDWSDAELMLEADVAPARRDAILQCAKCTNKAVRLDQFWPYQMDLNRCRAHLCSGGAERNARGDSLPKAGESAGPADKDPMGEAARFEPEGLAGDAWAALPPAANDDCQSRPSQARAHEAPKPCLAGEGAPS